MTRIVQFWSFTPIIDQPLLASLPKKKGASKRAPFSFLLGKGALCSQVLEFVLGAFDHYMSLLGFSATPSCARIMVSIYVYGSLPSLPLLIPLSALGHAFETFQHATAELSTSLISSTVISLRTMLQLVRISEYHCVIASGLSVRHSFNVTSGSFAKVGHVGRFSLSRRGVFYMYVRVNAAHGEAKYCPDVGYRNSERKALYSAALFEVHGVYICKIGACDGRLRSVNVTSDGNISASARPRSPNVRVSCSRGSGGRAP